MKSICIYVTLILCLISSINYGQNPVRWTNLHKIYNTSTGLSYGYITASPFATGEWQYGTAVSVNALCPGDTGSYIFPIESTLGDSTLFGFTINNFMVPGGFGYNFLDGAPGEFPGLALYGILHSDTAFIYANENLVGYFPVTAGDHITFRKSIDFANPDSASSPANSYFILKNNTMMDTIPFCEHCGGGVGFTLNFGVVMKNAGTLSGVQCTFGGDEYSFGPNDYSVTWDTTTFINAEIYRGFQSGIADTLHLFVDVLSPSINDSQGVAFSANILKDTSNGYVVNQWIGGDYTDASFGLASYKNWDTLGNINGFQVIAGQLYIYENGSLAGHFGTAQTGDVLEVLRYDGSFGWLKNGIGIYGSSYNMFRNPDGSTAASPIDSGNYSMRAFCGVNYGSIFFNLNAGFSGKLDTPVIASSIPGYCSGHGISYTVAVKNGKNWNHYKWYKNSTAISDADYSIYSEVSPPTSTTTYYVKAYDDYGDTLTSNTVTVTVGPIAINHHVTNVSPCHGDGNGIDSLLVSGGLGGYTYSWSPSGGTSLVATGLSAGSYTVTVTDELGCTQTRIDTITQPDSFSVSVLSSENVSCHGGNDGSAIIRIAGQTPSYTYVTSPAVGSSSGTTDSTAALTGLTVNTYSVEALDTHCGSTASTTFTILQSSTALSASITSSTNVSCYGGSNGSATVTATGGASGYTYLWTPGSATTSSVSGLSAGTYTVTVTDTYSCSTASTSTITQPSALIASISSSTNVSCFGDSSGSATIRALGGTSPFSYLWSPNGRTDTTIVNLRTGIYTGTITDALGCTTAITDTIFDQSNAKSSDFIQMACITYSQLSSAQQARYDTLSGIGNIDTIYFVHCGILNDSAYNGTVTINLPFLLRTNLNFVLGSVQYSSEDNYQWFGNFIDTATAYLDTIYDDSIPATYSSGTLTIASTDSKKYGNLVLDNDNYLLADLSGGIQVLIKKYLPMSDTTWCATASADTTTDTTIYSARIPNDCMDHTLRILVYYTPSAKATGLDPSSIAWVGVGQMLGIWNNSLIFPGENVVIVGVLPFNYSETYDIQYDLGQFMTDATPQSDGETVQQDRDIYHADIVVLFVKQAYDGSNIGVTPLSTIGSAEKTTAYAVCSIDYATSSVYNFTHEIGHLLGARHNTGADSDGSDYSHGHLFQGAWHLFSFCRDHYRTVMAYHTYDIPFLNAFDPPSCNGQPVVANFSNPNVKYIGKYDTGNSSTDNNAKKVNANMFKVEDYYTESLPALDAVLTADPAIDCCLTSTSASVSAVCGTPPYAYQWSKSSDGINYQNISGGTSSSATISVQTSCYSSNLYIKVVVTDAANYKITRIQHAHVPPCITEACSCHTALCPGCAVRLANPNSTGNTLDSIRNSMQEFSISPNPVDNQLILKYNHSETSSLEFVVLNVLGEKMTGKKYSSLSSGLFSDLIDTKNLPSGFYYLKVVTENKNSVLPFIVVH